MNAFLRWSLISFLASGNFFICSVIQANELSIKPGLWKTVTSRTNPLTGQLVTETNEECVSEDTFNPKALVKDMQDCQLTQNDLSGNTLKFQMTCKAPQAVATVNGSYTLNDKEGEGNMTMMMQVANMKMEMTVKWSAERIDDC